MALAPHLDTPTAPAAAAAAAAAAVQTKYNKKHRSTATDDGTPSASSSGPTNNGNGYVNDSNLQDRNADPEVLPRGWEVTDGAQVYVKTDSMGDIVGSGGSPYLRRGESIPYFGRDGRRGSGGAVDGRHSVRRRRRNGYDEAEGKDAGGNEAANRDSGSWLESGCGQMRWRELTRQPFDLLLLVDGGPELGRSRTLLSMPEYGVKEQERARQEGRRPGGFYLTSTMAEYYLLLSVYFGEMVPYEERWG